MKNKYSSQDFANGVPPKWCHGCGDYAVFKTLTTVFASQEIPKEQFVVVSGIGCSSRLPYYLSTYGFHSLHGRAPTVAMGVKIANPLLSVWVVTGDGDALAIGGNHYNHIMRRNPDVKIILFNNQIYGLTKGQLSPTSPLGLKTKTTPFGSIESPVQPIPQAIAAGATFAARVPYSEMDLLGEVFTAAAQHRGTAIIEVLVQCAVYGENLFDPITSSSTKEENTIVLKNKEPLIFGKNKDKGIVIENFETKIVSLNKVNRKDLFVHDASRENASVSFVLSSMSVPEFPLPIGIFRQVSRPTYEDALLGQEQKVTKDQRQRGSVDALMNKGTWEFKNST
jgi:2-oxoglutarate ferredoxin oxidoreductase subunit beta